MVASSNNIQAQQIDSVVKKFIPENWKLIQFEKGDLNKDGFEDLAIVIQDTDTANTIINQGFGYDTLDTNPRTLLVYFYNKETSKFEKKLESRNIIPNHSVPTMEDPFAGIIIKKSILEINYYFWYSAGSWYVTHRTYKFRFQNHDFYLIGIEDESTHRGTMASKSTSINFSTRKMQTIEFSSPTYDDEGEEHYEKKETWLDFKLNNLYKIEEIKLFSTQVLNEFF
mgnify:CR=1 FL=1